MMRIAKHSPKSVRLSMQRSTRFVYHNCIEYSGLSQPLSMRGCVISGSKVNSGTEPGNWNTQDVIGRRRTLLCDQELQLLVILILSTESLRGWKLLAGNPRSNRSQ